MRQTVATWFAKKGKTYIERSLLLIIAVLFLLLGSHGFLQGTVFAHEGDGKRHVAKTQVLVNVDGVRANLGGIKVNLSHPNQYCHGAPDPKSAGLEKVTDSDGVATFWDCGVSDYYGTEATYKLQIGDTPEGYEIQMPHSFDVTLKWNKKPELNVKEININYTKKALPPPPSSSSSSQSSTPKPDPPANHKEGRIRVITFIRESNGSFMRQAGFNVQTIPEGYTKPDPTSSGTLLNCDPFSKVTDQAGGNSVNNPNYAMAHFNKCWTASNDKKKYQIQLLGIPAGLIYRSMHITQGGKLSNGLTSTTNIDSCKPAENPNCKLPGLIPESFTVEPGESKEAQIEIWTDRAPVTDGVATITPPAPTPRGNGNNNRAPQEQPKPPRAAVREVFNQSSTPVVVALTKDEATQTFAQMLTASLSAGRALPEEVAPDCDPQTDPDGCNPDCPDETNPSCPGYIAPDKTAPKPPENLRVMASESGTPELSWDEVQPVDTNADGDKETISYQVERITNNANAQKETISSDLTDPKFTDDTDGGSSNPVKIPGSYTYYVYAIDDAGNISQPSIRIVDLVLQKAQVAAAPAGSANTPSELSQGNNNVPKVTVESVDQTTTITIPTGSGGEEALACDVVNRDSTANDTRNNIGEVQGSAVGLSCRNEQGEEEKQELEEPVEYEIDVENTLVSDDTELYVYDGTDWEEVDTSETIDEGETLDDQQFEEDTTIGKVKAGRVKGNKTKFKVKSKRILTLAVIDKYNTSPVVKIAVISTTIAALGGIGFMTYVIIMRRRIQARALHPYEDVDIRPLNPRVDYTPTLTAPEQREKKNDE